MFNRSGLTARVRLWKTMLATIRHTPPQPPEAPTLVIAHGLYGSARNWGVIARRLADRREAYPDKLSGGEQQRVAVARALVHDPQLVLADEPTGNLDIETGQQVLDLLDTLTRQDGKNLLMVTHSPEVVGLADRVFRITEGHLVEEAGGQATPDARHETPDARHQTPDARHQTPHARYQTRDTRHQMQDTELLEALLTSERSSL